MKPTSDFWLLVLCFVCIGASVFIAVGEYRRCTLVYYEPEIDPNYQLTERDREIKKAYRDGAFCHWSWEVIPSPSDYVVGSGPVRPILLSESKKLERLKMEAAMRKEVEWLKAKYPGLR